MLSALLISLLIGYGFGLFLTGYFLGKLENVDLTTVGSKNIGTTNTIRILGVHKGGLTLLGDCLKAVIPAAIVYLIYHGSYPGGIHFLMLVAAFGAVLGHDFPVYMGFKGGKGIATSAGLILICFPKALPLLILVFALIVFFTRYVSLGSITVAVLFPIEVAILLLGHFTNWYLGYEIPAFLISLFACVLAVYKHRSNIKRLLEHNENKFSFHPNRD